jgi:hypothetical protein
MPARVPSAELGRLPSMSFGEAGRDELHDK